MNLIKQYFTLEGRIYRSNQQLETFFNKNLKTELRTQFCTHFQLLAENAQWDPLNACCGRYLKQFDETDKSFLNSKLSVLNWENIVQQLLTETALALCTYLDYHEWVLELHAQKGQAALLFAYLQLKTVLNPEMIADAIQKWEKYQGVLMHHQDFAQHLKQISLQNPHLIPNKASIKESIEQYEEAAFLYETEHKFKKAAICFEWAHQYPKAIELYKKLNDKEQVSILSEKIGDFETALQYVLKPERKFNLLLITEQLQKAMAFANGLDNAEPFKALVQTKARQLMNQKLAQHHYIEALEVAEIAQMDPQNRSTLVEKARNYYLQQQLDCTDITLKKEIILQRIQLEVKMGHYQIAGHIAEETLQDIPLAIDFYEKANQFHKAIRLTREHFTQQSNLEVALKLADLHYKGGNWLKSAQLYEENDKYELAYDLYFNNAHYEKAIECYAKISPQQEEIWLDLYKAVGKYDKMIDIYVKRNTFTDLQLARDLAELHKDRLKIQVIDAKLEAFKSFSQADWDAKYTDALEKVGQQYSNIIGIDFGTTTSVCAVYNKTTTQVELITNPKGELYVDSYFGITSDAQYVFGDKAKLLNLTQPEGVVSRVKRFLGENKTFTIHNKTYTVEVLIAHQLNYLKDRTNAYFKEQVKAVFKKTVPQNMPSEVIDRFFQQKQLNRVQDVVLTVPAYFNDSQKRGIRDAAEIAGLNVRRLLHEPTAAAVAFEHQKDYKGKIAVIDLGGGTFDISIVDVDGRTFEVEEIGGNTKLGGSDIDELLFQYFQKNIQSTLNIDLSDKKYTIEAARLKEACENLKMGLSHQDAYIIELPYFLNTPCYTLTLTRTQLETIAQPFFDAFEKTILQTLSTFKGKIEHFILVGNATKMPKINQLSIKLIHKAKQLKGIDPGTVVAIGAAIDGAILTQDIVDKLILDIVPFSLGIVVRNRRLDKQVMQKMIERHSTIPIQKTDTFSTVEDNQTEVSIRIFQGEFFEPELNHFLGAFNLTGIPLAKANVPKIDVTFSVSSDCILTVTARDQATQKQQSIQITGSVRLSVTEKQNLARQFEHKTRLQSTEIQISDINQQIETLKTDFDKKRLAVRQAKTTFSGLFAEKLQLNPYYYKANAAQTKVFGEIFLERNEIFLENQKNIDKYSILNANFKKLLERHLDYTVATIALQLAERLSHMERFLADYQTLVARYQKEVVEKLLNWVDVLKNLTPDMEKMTLLQQAHFLMASNRFAEATTLLQEHLMQHATEVNYVETLLNCLKKTGDINHYKSTLYENAFLLNHLIPDFNRLNDYLKSVSDAFFLIVVQDENGIQSNGSGFSLADNLIVTNRHVVEGSTRIQIIGKNKVFEPIETIFDAQNDLALLRVREHLPKLRIGVSEFIEPGEKMIAIGFPSVRSHEFLENIYISQGVVNSIRKHDACTDRVIFIDNKIGSGMSGGPLINNIGEIVGIVTLIQYKIQNNIALENQPIALPIHLITQLMNEIQP